MAREECIKLIQKAINLLEASSQWNDRASMLAHRLLVEGEKRRDRHDDRDEHMTRQYLQHTALDLFGVELYPLASDVAAPKATDPEVYFKMYIKKLWASYEEVGQIANAIVAAGFHPLSQCLHMHQAYLQDEIIDTNRFIMEGDAAKWEFHHISRYQVSMKDNIHDNYEEKKRKQGDTY